MKNRYISLPCIIFQKVLETTVSGRIIRLCKMAHTYNYLDNSIGHGTLRYYLSHPTDNRALTGYKDSNFGSKLPKRSCYVIIISFCLFACSYRLRNYSHGRNRISCHSRSICRIYHIRNNNRICVLSYLLR